MDARIFQNMKSIGTCLVEIHLLFFRKARIYTLLQCQTTSRTECQNLGYGVVNLNIQGVFFIPQRFQLDSLILFLVRFSSSTHQSLQKMMRCYMKFQLKRCRICESHKTRLSKERIFSFFGFRFTSIVVIE